MPDPAARGGALAPALGRAAAGQPREDGALPMNARALIVEGNPQVRRFLCQVVQASFHDLADTMEAGSVEEALACTAPHPLGLVLVDLDLPAGGGLEFLARLAGHPARRVVTTLYPEDEPLFLALQHGVDGYLAKEDRFETLVEALQKIARDQPAMSPAVARRILAHEGELGMAAGPRSAARPALTAPEQEVLRHLGRGLTVREIAILTGSTRQAVGGLVRAIYRRLDSGRPAAA